MIYLIQEIGDIINLQKTRKEKTERLETSF
jgi:hypothetical protein